HTRSKRDWSSDVCSSDLTISNMLNRFYEIQSGKITYDGVPISQIRKNDLRHSLSIVLQETHLFTGTIMDNIRFGKPDASDDEVRSEERRVGKWIRSGM